jgi:hypothetical protein
LFILVFLFALKRKIKGRLYRMLPNAFYKFSRLTAVAALTLVNSSCRHWNGDMSPFLPDYLSRFL